MQVKRTDRLSALIKQEVSNIVLRDVKDPNVSFVTITKVTLSNDLSHCKIYFSALNDDKKQDVIDGMNRAKGFIRREIGQRIKIRAVPTLDLIYDDSTEYAANIQNLLNNL